MKDSLGRYLMHWRIRVALPYLKGRVLDVGCGTNELIAAYRERHPEHNCVGVDVHQWGSVDLILDDVAHMPFTDGEFDTVTCMAALNHIPNREDFLREARRVLAPDGVFIASMIPPGISRLWHTLRKPWDADQVERGMEEEEEYGFTRAAMRQLLERTGFAVDREISFMAGVNRLYLSIRSH